MRTLEVQTFSRARSKVIQYFLVHVELMDDRALFEFTKCWCALSTLLALSKIAVAKHQLPTCRQQINFIDPCPWQCVVSCEVALQSLEGWLR